MYKSSWIKLPLGNYFIILYQAITPSSWPDEEFSYFSIPAYDEFKGPILVTGKDIGSNKTKIQNPTILVSKLNPRIPRVILACPTPGKIACASTEFIPYVKTSDQICLGFYTWYFGSTLFQRQLERVATGSTNSHTRAKPSETLRWDIPIPSHSEQTRITYVLDSINEMISKTEAVIAKLKQVRAGMLHDMLRYGLDEHGQLRDPVAHPEQFKDSPLGLIPRDWDVMSLGMYCRRPGGSIQTGPFGSQLHASDYKDVGIPIITVEHLDEGRIKHENLPLVGKADYHRLYRYHLQAGDLVFSRVGAVDRCSLVSKKEDGWLFSGRCLRVRFEKNCCDPRFFSYQLNSHRCRRWILNNAVGSTMHCLNTRILSDLPIVVPVKTEQTQIAHTAFCMESNLASLESELSQLHSLKFGLEDDLLTGRVRVSETIMEGAERV